MKKNTAITAMAAAERIISGGAITPDEALCLLDTAPRAELHEAAHLVTRHCTAPLFDFCGIVNARCGRCTENCKWCAQSAHWAASCDTWGWIGAEKCVEAALDAEKKGAVRFAIVTSGRAQTPEQIDQLCEALREMRRRTRIHLCGSLGLLTEADLARLQEAGLERYHCNIETAPSHFDALCTTHTIAEKLQTLRAARKLGLQICCGGIIGMGESRRQLVEFAFTLREIAPDSIPVNILHPIPGTPLGNTRPIPLDDILDAIATIRLANPKTPLRFAGGRASLSDDEAAQAIHVGISAGIAGPLLTTTGGDYNDDRHLAQLAGYEVRQELRNP